MTSKDKIKHKRIHTFHQYVKYLVEFGFDYNRRFANPHQYIDDFLRSINPKEKPRVDKKLRSYLLLAIKSNIIELNPDPQEYKDAIILTEFGARYLLNVNDHIKSSLLSGAFGAVLAAILTAVVSALF